MINTNDHIIEAVFQAILEHVGPQAPESAFYNSLKMANLPIDNRMLANFIIQDFPWPIGVELRRLFSGDLKNRDKNRVDQLLKAGEKTAQFFAYCMLVQLWDEVKSNKDLELSKDFSIHIAQLDKPSFGIYVALIRSIHKIFENAGISPFINYNTPNFSAKKFIQNFSSLVNMRNEDRHHTSEMDCHEGEEILRDLLVDLAVFSRYKLVTIKEIKVVGPKLKPVIFHHSMRMLNSQHEDFSLAEHSLKNHSESHAVLLVEDIASPDKSLNLSPFVVDTGTMMENQKLPGIKNGIYTFSQVKDDKYIYLLTTAPEPAVFNVLPNFSYLQDQFDDIRETLQGEAVEVL